VRQTAAQLIQRIRELRGNSTSSQPSPVPHAPPATASRQTPHTSADTIGGIVRPTSPFGNVDILEHVDREGEGIADVLEPQYQMQEDVASGKCISHEKDHEP
jgi:hypothetical protein